MSLLAAASYDPGTVTTTTLTALSAQSAIDTTNLRCTFTAPAAPLDGAGKTVVMARIRGVVSSSTNAAASSILLGVLEGSTVKGRAAPITGRIGASAGSLLPVEATFPIGGLTPGSSHTWDASVGVEFAVTNSMLKYGGPNDTTLNNAYGSVSFDVWSCEPLLSWKHYDPGTVANMSVTAASVITAIDATNLTHTFTPTGSAAMVRMRGVVHGGTVGGAFHFGVLESGVVRGRTRTNASWTTGGTSPVATDLLVQQSRIIIPGLTPGLAYTWQAALGVETAMAGGNLSYGGPDDATQDNAYGGFTYEVWDTNLASSDQYVYAVGQVI